MFDLFGRGELKERIAELEAELAEVREENGQLREQLDAESERRKAAVSDRQAAQEEVNRLQDRIAQLEGEVERLSDDELELAYRGTETLRPERTRTVIDRLESVDAGEQGALTAVVDEAVPQAVRETFGERSALVDRASPCVAVADDAGLVSAALRPPVMPDHGVVWDSGFQLDRATFLPTGRFALALVRADLFAIGEYQGDERLDVEAFESEVKGDHSKGGFSQDRFERRRDDQIDAHLDRCRSAIDDREADRLYVVGDRAAVGEFEDEAIATAAVDASGDPEAALSGAFRDFWTTRLYLI